jgi:hypothetical protein
MFSYVFVLTLWLDYTHEQDIISLHGKICVNCKKTQKIGLQPIAIISLIILM